MFLKSGPAAPKSGPQTHKQSQEKNINLKKGALRPPGPADSQKKFGKSVDSRLKPALITLDNLKRGKATI